MPPARIPPPLNPPPRMAGATATSRVAVSSAITDAQLRDRKRPDI